MPVRFQVLILEDRPSDAELILQALRGGGFDPHAERVDNEVDYLARLAEPWDLIVSDYHLPQFDALRAIQLLQQRGLDVPFIIVSGTAGEEMAIEAMRRGARDYILKDHLPRLVPAVERELREAAVRLERRRLERELAVRELMLKAFFDASPAGMAILDSHFRFLEVNQTLAEMNGLLVAEHLGRTLRERLPKLAPSLEPLLSGVLDTGQPVLNVEISGEVPSRPGELRYWMGSYFPIPGATGTPEVVGAVVVEISAQKRAERVRAELAAIVEFSEDAIIGKTLAGEITSWNKGAERIYGYTASEIVGQPISILVPPGCEAEVPQFLARLRRGEAIAHWETTRQRKDARRIAVSLTISPIRDPQGTVIGASTIARDITARKHAEVEREQLLSVAEATGQRLHQLARRILTIQEEERRRVSRELHDEAGQALTVLKMHLASLQEDLTDQSPALRQRVADSVALTESTMDQLRSLAQALRPPALDSLTLDVCLHSICREFNRRTGIAVTYRGCELPKLSDPMSICLYRILQEALTNVGKHADANSVQVELRVRPPMLMLSVVDDGKGFVQQDQTVAGNTGSLGLLGMRERVELLSGQLKITAQPGHGVRVLAEIPLEKNR